MLKAIKKGRSIVIVFQGNDGIDFMKKLLNFFVNVSNVLSVSFVLSFIIPLFVGVFVFGAKLAINFGFFSAFLFAEEFFDGGDGTGDSFSVFQNVVEFRVRGKFGVGLIGSL